MRMACLISTVLPPEKGALRVTSQLQIHTSAGSSIVALAGCCLCIEQSHAEAGHMWQALCDVQKAVEAGK